MLTWIRKTALLRWVILLVVSSCLILLLHHHDHAASSHHCAVCQMVRKMDVVQGDPGAQVEPLLDHGAAPVFTFHFCSFESPLFVSPRAPPFPL